MGQVEARRDPRGVEVAVSPCGDVLYRFGEFVGTVAASGVFEVEDSDALPVPQVVGQVSVAGAKNGRGLRCDQAVQAALLEPAGGRLERRDDNEVGLRARLRRVVLPQPGVV